MPRLALSILVLLGLAACRAAPTAVPGRDGTSTRAPKTLRVADLLNVDVRDVPLLMAFEELTARGYVVEKRYFDSAALIVESLARGDADVGIVNNQSAWTAAIKGAGIRTISHFTAPATLLAASESIRSCRDLDGRKVGVPSTTGLSPLLFRRYLTRRCSNAAPQLLVLPESGARAAALMSGVVDAAMMPGEELLKIQRQSSAGFHALMTNAQEAPEVQIDGLQLTRAWGEHHRDLVLDLLRAQVRAHRLIYRSPEILWKQTVGHLSIDADTARAITEVYLRMSIWDEDAGLTLANAQATLDLLVEEKVLPSGVTASQVTDLSYLNSVLNEVGRRGPRAPPARSQP